MNLGRQAQNEPEGIVEAVRVEACVQSSRAVDEAALVVERVCIYLRAFSFERHAGPPLLPLSYVAWYMKSRAGQLGNKTLKKQYPKLRLRLHDGRRAFADGNRYVDEDRALTGADEAEAARQHQYQPNASTWEQKQEIDRKAEEARRLKEKILKDREQGIGPEEAGNRLTGYEKEFAQQAQERAAQAPVEFGAADYMADYGVPSAVPAFALNADPVTGETVRRSAEDEGTATAEMQKTSRPSGQGAFKLG